MDGHLLMLKLSLALVGGCVALDGDRVQSVERSLIAARSPDFSEDHEGHLDVKPDGLLAIGDAVLACSEEGMSLTWLQDDGDVGKEWLEEDSSRESDQALACQHLDGWGDQVALSAEGRVRIFDVYAEGDEPDWWEDAGQAGPLGWARDLVDTDEDWEADRSEHGDWRTLDDVSSTAYDQKLETGYIARCCDRRQVLVTDAEGSTWDLLQLVADEYDVPESLVLETGKVDGSRYLFGVGEDALYAVALDGGPALPLPDVASFIDGDRAQIRAVQSDTLWIGAGKRSALYELSADSEEWHVSFDVGDAPALDAEDLADDSSKDVHLAAYTYERGEGLAILDHQTDAYCLQVNAYAHAYLFCSQKLSWTDARAQCQSYGDFDLVEVLSYDERNWVVEHNASLLDEDAWTGLNDRSEEGNFDWTTGDSDHDDIFLGNTAWWVAGQPNDAGDGEDCVALDSNQGRWKDEDCDDEFPYICESLN